MALRMPFANAAAIAISSQTHRKSKPRISLLTFEESPTCYDANKFIHTGYRPQSKSMMAAVLFSWTYLHNESCNICSHLIPAALSIVGQWPLHRYIFDQYPMASWGDRLLLSFHVFTISVCLGISSLFHTFKHHSPQVVETWLVNDFMGIVSLIFGDFMSDIYFGFYCEWGPRLIYSFMVGILCFLIVFLIL